MASSPVQKRTLAEVATEFLKSRQAMGVRSRTLTQYESYLRTIGERFGSQSINEVRRGEIVDWLSESEWSKRTRNNYVSTLSTLFLFARGRDYCAENPAEKVPRAILDDTPPGILTVKEAAALLEIPREKDSEMLANVAIGLFAGLRRSELCALEWSEIDRNARSIEVKEAKAKTRQWRIESGLHQRLDVSHLDDLSRVRKPRSMHFMGMFRRLSNSLCMHWIPKQPRSHHKTTTDFFSTMNASHHRYAFRCLFAAHPSFSQAS